MTAGRLSGLISKQMGEREVMQSIVKEGSMISSSSRYNSRKGTCSKTFVVTRWVCGMKFGSL